MKVQILASTAFLALASQLHAAPPAKIDSLAAKEQYRFSYSIGADIGKSVKQIGYTLDGDLLAQGLLDALQGKDSLVMNSEAQMKALQEFQTTLMKAKATKDSLEAAQNSAKAKAFLDKNKKVKGVVTTTSGVQYSYIKKGTGPSPKPTDIVNAHYVGTLLDGTEFDNSIKRGEPISFPLDRVIKGWQELLPLLKTGDKVKCWIPPELGYGDQGNQTIPANSLLIFEIELLGAIPAKQ